MKKETFKTVLKLLSIPLSLLGIYLLFLVLWKVLGLPDQSHLVVSTKNYFNHYGIWIVFIAALIEGVLVVGEFFPGGVVIFLGVATSRGNIPHAVLVVMAVSISFFISYYINYLMGKHGWYRLFLKFGLKKPIEDAKEKLSRHEFNAIMLSYWEPNLASVMATAAGVLRIPLKRFLPHSALGIIVWNTFWGILVYQLGERALDLIGLKYGLIVFFAWVAIILIKRFVFEKQKIPAQ